MYRYDCSSADLNPIGSISKTDLKRFIKYSIKAFDLDVLQKFLDATPTAELLPIEEGKELQSDEAEMGMTYGKYSEIRIVRPKLAHIVILDLTSRDRRALYLWHPAQTVQTRSGA
jgi:NH3-dependent NAD+ synthetase